MFINEIESYIVFQYPPPRWCSKCSRFGPLFYPSPTIYPNYNRQLALSINLVHWFHSRTLSGLSAEVDCQEYILIEPCEDRIPAPGPRTAGKKVATQYLYWVNNKLSNTVRNLGACFDNNLGFDKHICLAQVCGSCLYHICDQRSIRKHVRQSLAWVLVTSGLDYGNHMSLKHSLPLLCSLHWLTAPVLGMAFLCQCPLDFGLPPFASTQHV